MKVTPENYREFLPKGFKLFVRHYHQGNDPEGEVRTTPRYATSREFMTVAHIKDSKNRLVSVAQSVCCPSDTPNRRRGWEIAVSRAVKMLTRNYPRLGVDEPSWRELNETHVTTGTHGSTPALRLPGNGEGQQGGTSEGQGDSPAQRAD